MGPLTFSPQFVPNDLHARIVRQAVLYRLFRPARSVRGIRRNTKRAVGLWRNTLHRLQVCEWLQTDAISTMAAVNCMPSFCFCRPRSRPCNVRRLCPFCYARQVDAWMHLIVDAVVEKPGPLRLAVHRKELCIGYDGEPTLLKPPGRYEKVADITCAPGYEQAVADMLRDRLTSILARRAQWVRELQPVGALCVLHVEPWATGWHVTNNQLLLLPEAANLPESNLSSEWQEYPTHDSASLGKALVCTAAYPGHLLRSPAVMLAIQLRALRGLRLTSTFGTLRRRTRDEL